MTQSELSRIVQVDDLPNDGREIEVVATAEERDAVSRRLQLDGVESLSANVLVKPTIGQQILLEGEATAAVQQTCVVSGDPVVTELTFSLRRVFDHDVDSHDEDMADEDVPLVDPEVDDADAIVDGEIDIGESLIEELSLQIPPYPRKEGATFSGYETGPEAESKPDNPFAVLSTLKLNDNSES